MKFTGERVIPNDPQNKYLYLEHLARYMYAAQFVPGQQVLDLGCGTGYGTEYLATQGAKYIVGVDISGETISYANTHYKQGNIVYLPNDCLNISLKDSSFDVVVSFEVIEHIESWQHYLTEAARVLRPGGYFIGSTPNKQLHSPDQEQSPNPFHVREYFLTDLQQMLTEYFENVWILSQSPLQGFLISQEQSLKPLVKARDWGNSVELMPNTCHGNPGVEQAKDFVFICQKKNGTISNGNSTLVDISSELSGKVYISEPGAGEFMRIIQIARSQQILIDQLNTRLTELNNLLRAYQKGRFIRFMAWVSKFKTSLFSQSGGNN